MEFLGFLLEEFERNFERDLGKLGEIVREMREYPVFYIFLKNLVGFL